MGVARKDNKATTLEDEKRRVMGFIEKDTQLNWMIEYRGKVVGSVWVDLESTEHVPSPAVHIMIGDPEARGKGIGMAATTAVVRHLERNGSRPVYSRHLAKNTSAKSLLNKLGFMNMGGTYIDKDGLEWQNVIRTRGNDEKL